MKVRVIVIILFFLFYAPYSMGFSIKDMAGRRVELPSEVKRIICLGPGCLRIIVYLDAEEFVVGVEDIEKRGRRVAPYIIANPQLSLLPSIASGGPSGINKKPYMEQVLRIKPQVIFATYMEKKTADEIQKALNIPVVVLDYGSYSDFGIFYRSLKLAGKILKRRKRAEDLINFIENSKEDVIKRSSSSTILPRVYVGCVGYKGAHGIESTDADYIPLNWVKLINVAKFIKSRIGTHVFLDKEKLLQIDPDVIFIDAGGFAILKMDFKKRPVFYKSLKAFRTKKVYLLYPYNYYSTNIETAILDAYAVGKTLYPEKFKDICLKEKAREIYNIFVGADVSNKLEKIYGKLTQTINLF